MIYTPESIIDFMDFDRIEDNMIIQKKGKFLMIVECQGINYDLMSDMEKVSVEQGFISFLNTLRHPVQLYIQTRTINLERSVDGYKTKLREIERSFYNIQSQYESLLKSNTATDEQIDRTKYELVKQKNLKEYTEDIIRDIERQSLNRSILSKRYYVIIPCYQSEIVAGDFDKSEIKSMAFSELYTRAQSLIRSLFACEMKCKILNSEELVELLYVAYNRDESETYSVERAIRAGYNELYATAPDVLDKRMKAIDSQIEEKAIDLAKETIDEVRLEKERKIKKKEENFEELVKQMAEVLLKENEKYVGKDVAEKAIEKLNNTEEGGNTNEQKTKRTRRISNAK